MRRRSRGTVSAAFLGVVLGLVGTSLGATAAGGSRPEHRSPVGPASHPAAVLGRQDRVVLMCRFNGSPTAGNKTRQYFEVMFDDPDHGLEAYFAEASYGRMTVSETVHDWITLPGSRADYDALPDDPSAYYPDTGTLFDDCTAGHDGAVDFAAVDGIDMVFNDSLGVGGVGGLHLGTLDGVERYWRTTWLPSGSDRPDNPALWAHEMGHSFGLPHSTGIGESFTQHYWDPMGYSWNWCYNHGNADADYGCFPTHYLAAHKDAQWLGWIQAKRRYVATVGSKQVVTLERLAQPRANRNMLIARIPIPGSKPAAWYTAEARIRVGYFDSRANIPGDGVIITRVQPRCVDPGGEGCTRDYTPTQVVGRVGSDGFFPDPAASLFKAGETFRDRDGGVTVKVLAKPDPASFRVSISVAGSCFGKRATRTGTPRGDVMRGTPKADVIDGAGGDDTIIGTGGNDLLCGGAGADLLRGDAGGDRLDGGSGRDVCIGGAGSDSATRRCETKRTLLTE